MIRFEALAKTYGARRAVSDLSFVVARGETVALLGPNGSGKTTTLKSAAGLVRPSSGAVRIGEPPRDAADARARAAISYLPQRVSFPETLTGVEALEFFRALRGAPPDRVPEVLRFASLNGASARPIGTYSGGMVQRLGLAVAMLPDAPILLLDEPTAALDPDGLCAFYGLVERRRREGHTLLFSSHQLGDVERLADRFVLLVEGRLVADFTQAELAERLSSRGLLRVRLARRIPGLVETLRPLAPGAAWSGDELVAPGPAALRPRLLDLIREAGAEIRGLTSEEGRLDALYREVVAERS
ncbi:MAG TPA: ABC transporter ATP-binding protein [Thermoanaerobaculia bacterium]